MRADVVAAVEALVAMYPEAERADALRQIIADSIEELAVIAGREAALDAVRAAVGPKPQEAA